MKREMLTISIMIIILIQIFLVNAKDCGGTIQCDCGDTLISSHTMDYDILNCSSTGLIIGSNNLVLDCNGHSITGMGVSSGIHLIYNTNVFIQNCNISKFGDGIRLDSFYTIEGFPRNTTFFNNTISNNEEKGIFVFVGYLNISNNKIFLNKFGISSYHGSTSVISNNIIFNNSDTGIERNILDWYHPINQIISNQIYNNGKGISYFTQDIDYIPNDNVSYNNIFNNGNNFFDFNIYQYNSNLLFQSILNYWGTTNKNQIENKISGNVTYIPFLCEPYLTNWISDLNGNCVKPCKDSDDDGVCDPNDLCPKTPQGIDVDQDGCSNIQFCAKRPICGFGCDLADWKNNEPGINPHDCITIIVEKEGKIYPRCVGYIGTSCGG